MLFYGIQNFLKDLKSAVNVRGLHVSGICDLPEKAIFLNINQYNGMFESQVCKQE